MSREYDNTNTGALFINDKQGVQTRPDMRGSLDVNGVKYWISGWAKQHDQYGEYLSISIQEKDQQQAPRRQQQQEVNRSMSFLGGGRQQPQQRQAPRQAPQQQRRAPPPPMPFDDSPDDIPY